MKFLHSIYINIVFSVLVIIYSISMIMMNLELTNNSFIFMLDYIDVYIMFFGVVLLGLFHIIGLFFNLYSLKKTEKSFKYLEKYHKILLIFYGVSILLLSGVIIFKIINMNMDLLSVFCMIILFLFTIFYFRNRSVLRSITNKKYLEELNISKSTSIVISIYLIIFVIMGVVYSRELDIYDIPKDYFKDYQVNILNPNIELFPEGTNNKELNSIAGDYFSDGEKKVSILNQLENNPELVIQLKNISENSINYSFENVSKNNTYNFGNYIGLVKIQSLYADYELSLGNTEKAKEVLTNTLENNQKLFEKLLSFRNTLTYIETQNIVFSVIERNNNILIAQQIKVMMSNINTISAKQVFKNTLNYNMIASHKHTEFLINFPMFLDFKELNDIHKYYTYISIENKGEKNDDLLIQPKWTRKNYFGIHMVKDSVPSYKMIYKNLELLEENINKYKN